MYTYSQFLQQLGSIQETAIKPGLERMERVCAELDHPERKFKSIHIAGTNGKGGTAAYLEHIIRTNGYKVGLYTSPHLVSVRERIQINRKWISEREIAGLFKFVGKVVPAKAGIQSTLPDPSLRGDDLKLSYFELLTAIAFIYFANQKVDYAILETGLGGRWDATNVVHPELAVLTPISIDHTSYLGDDIQSIAREKCGIIKKSSFCHSKTPLSDSRVSLCHSERSEESSFYPVVSANQFPEVLEIIEATCKEQNSRLIFAPASLHHDFRITNATLAIRAAKELGIDVDNIDPSDLINNADWLGRLQTIVIASTAKQPHEHATEILLDGAHNPDACLALSKHIENKYKDREIIFVFGAMKDKDIGAMVANLKRVASGWVILPLEGSRAATAGQLKNVVGPDSVVAKNTIDAIDKAKEFNFKNPLIVVTGSLYLVGSFLKDTRYKMHDTRLMP